MEAARRRGGAGLRTAVVAAALAAVLAVPSAEAAGVETGGAEDTRAEDTRAGAAGAEAAGAEAAGAGTAGGQAEGVGPEVAEGWAAWQEADRALAEAEAVRDDLAAALADAEAVERAAADVVDTETALLVRREREVGAADTALRQAEQAVTYAVDAQQQSVRAYERALIAAVERRAELGEAAASAYANGDPRIKTLSGVVHALDQTSSVADFLATTERLAYVTVDARKTFDTAGDELRERAGDALVAASIVGDRRREEEAAAQALADAQEAAETQRARSDAALAAHDEALAAVEQAAAALADAEGALTAAREALGVAHAAVQALGWRAGAPGPHGLLWPVDGRPGSGFGARVHPIHGDVRRHLGVDVSAPTGQPVVAAATGEVVHAGPRGGYGLAVVIDHGGGRTTLYAHFSGIAVRRGQQVEQAQLIGQVGSTGQSTGPHLHFEVREGGRHVDPMQYFR